MRLVPLPSGQSRVFFTLMNSVFSAFVLSRVRVVALLSVALALSLSAARAADRTVLLIAGTPSHGPAQHEHNAGMLLFQKCLASVPGLKTRVVLNGWPRDAAAFDGVDAVVIYADGGPKHPALVDDHLAILGKLMAHGVGFGVLHYAVEPTLEKGQAEFLQWVGGAFEINWSVNPTWDANFATLPEHAVTRGVKPFRINDEWYFNMRFADGMKGIAPLLVTVPGADTMKRRDGPHEGNAAVRAMVARGEKQMMAWVFERPDGGRGFGFTGGHYHRGWGNDDMRKLVLNAIVWLAHVEVPAGGVVSKVTAEDLLANLDPKGPKPEAAPTAASAEAKTAKP